MNISNERKSELIITHMWNEVNGLVRVRARLLFEYTFEKEIDFMYLSPTHRRCDSLCRTHFHRIPYAISLNQYQKKKKNRQTSTNEIWTHANHKCDIDRWMPNKQTFMHIIHIYTQKCLCVIYHFSIVYDAFANVSCFLLTFSFWIFAAKVNRKCYATHRAYG